MKLSPFQLEAYYATSLSCQANLAYNPGKETRFSEKDLEVTPNVQPIKDQPRRWQVALDVKLHAAPESNSPYTLCLNLIGIIWVAPELAPEKLESLLRTNGPSMVYGVVREMARDLTARGPFTALVLPSVSFIPDAPTTPVAPSAPSAEPASPKPEHP